MDTLVIIGNGFDIDLGWKTSYSHFFNSYWGNCTKQYIPDLKEQDNWNNLEGYLRRRAIDLNEGDVEKLWFDWLKCKSNIWEYFRRGKENGIFETDTDSCAYHLLTCLSQSVIFTFNYTEPNYYISGLPCFKFNHIHGALWDGNSGSEIRLGFDTSVKCKFKNAEKIKPLLKSIDNNLTTSFLKSIKEASTIIVYGHSFGITDSDYFKPILERMIDDRISGKLLYIVTRNEMSMKEIKNNMASYEIDYNELMLSNNEIIEIYTEKKKENTDFKEMILKL